MKKNKLYLILAILSTIFLISFAAVCNQCGTAAAEEEEEEEIAEEETAEEETAEEEMAEEEEEEEVAEEETAEEEEEEEAEEEEEENTEPTISISIYEGPTYSAADGVCYYRVQANVTGSPSPSVDWNRDDSDGAWGTRKAQINLEDPGDTYTLTATATNSEGTDTDSIELIWGCEEEVAEEPEVHEVNVPVALTEAGYIEWGGAVWYPRDSIFAGDSTGDKQCRGYMGFEIGGLAGVTITEASLSLSPEQVWGDPTFLGSLWIDVVDWGAGPLEMADFNIAYVQIQSFNNSVITCTNSKLKTELQSAINDGKSRFRIRTRFTTPATDTDGQWDGWDYLVNEVVLHVSYTE